MQGSYALYEAFPWWGCHQPEDEDDFSILLQYDEEKSPDVLTEFPHFKDVKGLVI